MHVLQISWQVHFTAFKYSLHPPRIVLSCHGMLRRPVQRGENCCGKGFQGRGTARAGIYQHSRCRRELTCCSGHHQVWGHCQLPQQWTARDCAHTMLGKPAPCLRRLICWLLTPSTFVCPFPSRIFARSCCFFNTTSILVKAVFLRPLRTGVSLVKSYDDIPISQAIGKCRLSRIV